MAYQSARDGGAGEAAVGELIQPVNTTNDDQFWGAYTIDVYSATTWGLVVRHREYQSNVLYPTEVYDDDEITETGIEPRPGPRKVSFLTGWNFTSDLYRILEHALDQLRMRAHFNDNSRVTALYADRAGPSVEEVLEVVDRLYDDLPAEFKFAKAMSGNIDEDRYGYQGALLCFRSSVNAQRPTLSSRCRQSRWS